MDSISLWAFFEYQKVANNCPFFRLWNFWTFFKLEHACQRFAKTKSQGQTTAAATTQMICGHFWQITFVDLVTLDSRSQTWPCAPLVNVVIILFETPTKMRIDMSSRIILGQKLRHYILLFVLQLLVVENKGLS